MQYTTLGNTGLRVSVAGLGTGGFSRMGLKAGKTEEEAAPEAISVRLVRWLAEVFGVQPPPGRSFEEMSLGELVSLAVSTEERRAQRR